MNSRRRRSTIDTPMAQLSASPDSSWIEHDRDGGWTLQPTILLAKASTINRTRDGAKLDSEEKARPKHDGLQIADTLDAEVVRLHDLLDRSVLRSMNSAGPIMA